MVMGSKQTDKYTVRFKNSNLRVIEKNKTKKQKQKQEGNAQMSHKKLW